MRSLNLLNFVCIVVFVAESALENVKLAIIKRLELCIFFAHFQPW